MDADMCARALRTEWQRRTALKYTPSVSATSATSANDTVNGNAFFSSLDFGAQFVPSFLDAMNAVADWRSPDGALGVPLAVGLPVWLVYLYDAIEAHFVAGGAPLSSAVAASCAPLRLAYAHAVLSAKQRRLALTPDTAAAMPLVVMPYAEPPQVMLTQVSGTLPAQTPVALQPELTVAR